MKKLLLTLPLLLITAVLWAAGSKDKADSLAAIQKKGVIVMGTSADYEPYEFHTSVNGKDTIVGFDVDIAKVVAEKLGVQLKIEEMSFDGLITALATGKIDMVIAGMIPTPERKKNVDFTQTYYGGGQTVLIRKADAGKYKTLADFAGKTVTVQLGTYQEQLAEKYFKSSKVEGLSKVPDLVLGLQYNKTDVVIIGSSIASHYVKADPSLAMIEDIFPDEPPTGVAIAFKKNSAELVAAADKVIDDMKADGTLQKLIDAWLLEAE